MLGWMLPRHLEEDSKTRGVPTWNWSSK